MIPAKVWAVSGKENVKKRLLGESYGGFFGAFFLGKNRRKKSTKKIHGKVKSEFGSFAAKIHTARIRPWENGWWKIGPAFGNPPGFSPPRPLQPSWVFIKTWGIAKGPPFDRSQVKNSEFQPSNGWSRNLQWDKTASFWRRISGREVTRRQMSIPIFHGTLWPMHFRPLRSSWKNGSKTAIFTFFFDTLGPAKEPMVVSNRWLECPAEMKPPTRFHPQYNLLSTSTLPTLTSLWPLSKLGRGNAQKLLTHFNTYSAAPWPLFCPRRTFRKWAEYCFDSAVSEERTHWVLRQTQWVLQRTRWVRFGTQKEGWEELTAFSARRPVSERRDSTVWKKEKTLVCPRDNWTVPGTNPGSPKRNQTRMLMFICAFFLPDCPEGPSNEKNPYFSGCRERSAGHFWSLFGHFFWCFCNFFRHFFAKLLLPDSFCGRVNFAPGLKFQATNLRLKLAIEIESFKRARQQGPLLWGIIKGGIENFNRDWNFQSEIELFNRISVAPPPPLQSLAVKKTFFCANLGRWKTFFFF